MKKEIFEKIYVEYYERIFKYCYFHLNDKEEGLNITQEVFTIFYERLEELKNHSNIGGFLYKTAKNLVRVKKRENYKKLLLEINVDEKIEFIEDNKSDILFTIDKKINEYEYIYEVIDSLDDEKKKLYEMYYINGKKMSEIADILKIDYNALRMRFVRLRNEIRNNVKKLAEEKF